MKIKIGNKIIGNGRPCFIVAEISGNHNGNINFAKKLIYNAKKSGADAVKLQTYKPETITLNCKSKDFLINKNSPWKKNKTYWELYKKAHTPWEWHKELFRYAKQLGIIIFSSPFDETAVEFLEKLNCPAYKIASAELNHHPLLKRIAKTKKPVFFSTGLSNFKEIKNAYSYLTSKGVKKIIIMKCDTSYPSKLDDANLKTLGDIKKKFNNLAGYSDHTESSIAAISAVALGANVIEKHFKLKKLRFSVDKFFSLDEKEFKEMIKAIRDLEKCIGKISYSLSKNSKNNLNGKRSIYFCKNISKNSRITKENIKIVRPSYGLDPKFYFKILGKKVKRDFKSGDRVNLKYLKNN